MGCKTIPEQLSEATVKQTVNTTDQMAVVENTTLYNVTVGDFATALGLTGSITSLDTNATPILVGTAPDYQIRGIRGGNGISAQVNIDGNITLNMNVQNAGATSDGLTLIRNNAVNSIEWKRLKAGIGVTLESETNSIVINADNTTRPLALASLSAPAVTTITGQDTPVGIEGTFKSDLASAFTVTPDGRATYIGGTTIQASIEATITASSASGTATFTFYAAVNGTVATNSSISRTFGPTDVGNLSLVWAAELSTNDYVDIEVENNSNNVDCQIDKLVFRIDT